jgi:hypothetical protein
LYNTLAYSLMRPAFHIAVCLLAKLCSVPFIVDLLWSEVWDIMSARYYWLIVIFICMVLHYRFVCFLLCGLYFMCVLRCIGCLLSVRLVVAPRTALYLSRSQYFGNVTGIWAEYSCLLCADDKFSSIVFMSINILPFLFWQCYPPMPPTAMHRVSVPRKVHPDRNCNCASSLYFIWYLSFSMRLAN